jgi:hypothetical protein
MIEWTAEDIVNAIRDEIDAYKKLKARLTSALGAEARRIELQMYSRSATIYQVLRKDLVETLGRADLWEQFNEWEKRLS